MTTANLDLALALLVTNRLDEACDAALEAILSGRVVPSNHWRVLEIVKAVEARDVPEATDLREAYQRLRRNEANRSGGCTQGQRWVTPGPRRTWAGTTAVWLPASEARAWAVLGNAEAAREAIERAERAWDHVRPDELDDLGGLATFDRPRQLHYADLCRARHKSAYADRRIMPTAGLCRPPDYAECGEEHAGQRC